MTKPKILIRIAMGLVLFFAMGHSIGHFTRHEVNTVNETMVLKAMDIKFDLFGHTTNYDGMYTGLSLDLIFVLLVFAVLLWHISNVSANNKKLAMQLLWPITLCLFVFSITNFMFFFPVPAITCLLAGLILGYALIRLNTKENS